VRIVLVTGKGGVGKTTLATATAVSAAARGKRTLLVSTDAAHSLSDVLLRQLEAEPVSITRNLEGVQIDARHELLRSWGTIANYLKRLLDLTEIDQLRLEELVVMPGLDQLVALARLHSLAEGPWDAMVVDCAPSADSLRLLSLPDVLHWYVAKLFGRTGTIARLGRKRIERTFSLPMPDDGVLASIEDISEELYRLQAILSDSTTTARVVVTPERVVIAEGQRTMAYLALYGYAVDAVLVNRVPPADLVSPEAAPYFAGQYAQLEAIDETFASLPRLRVRHRPVEPLGLDALEEIGEELYGDGDPLAKLSFTPALEITSTGKEPMVKLFIPGATRDEIQLEHEDDELIVTIGAHRRTVRLPDGLNGRRVSRAGVRNEHLEVFFGEVVHG
jgi:arsenite-transporting ATPase